MTITCRCNKCKKVVVPIITYSETSIMAACPYCNEDIKFFVIQESAVKL